MAGNLNIIYFSLIQFRDNSDSGGSASRARLARAADTVLHAEAAADAAAVADERGGRPAAAAATAESVGVLRGGHVDAAGGCGRVLCAVR